MNLNKLNQELIEVLESFYDIEPNTNIYLEFQSFDIVPGGFEKFEIEGVEFFRAENENLEDALITCLEEVFLPSWKRKNNITSFEIIDINYNEDDGIGTVEVAVY